MKRKIVLTKKEAHILTSVVENDEIVEINCCREIESSQHVVGNIYVGKVKNIVSNIGAAFIEIQKGVECYYKMEGKPLRVGDELLVQIKREAAKGKAATVTTKWSLQGRYVVLSPGESKVFISAKIAKERKEKLQERVALHLTKDYGFIVRTNAEHTSWEEVEKELKSLIHRYEQMIAIADKRVCYTCLYRQPAEYLKVIRNVRQEGLEAIIVEDEVLYHEVFAYLKSFQLDILPLLRRYEDSLLALHKLYSIDHVLEESLRERVWLKSGAYLMIQPTEACTVIDVNTGKAIRKKDISFRINLEAAKEIARQIRIRNLSGVILVDFINLSDTSEVQQLMRELGLLLKRDPIATTLVDITKLQFVEITRQKIQKPLAESFQE
jgi:Ribonucleases G and E